MSVVGAKALSFQSSTSRVAAALFFGIFAFSNAWSREAKAEYKIASGDVIEISIISLPEFRQRLMVDINGNIAFPLVGEIKVDGATLEQIRALVKEQITRRSFTRVTSDGREKQIAVSPQEVTINIIEYRPIYIRGDVARPGEHPFRPGMTIRQATALAGGRGVLGRQPTEQQAELVTLRGEDTSLRLDLLREQARNIRAQAELDGDEDANFISLTRLGLPEQLVSKVSIFEAENLKARRQAFEQEKAFLRGEIVRGEERIRALERQMQADTENAKADALESAKVRDLMQKGLATTARLADAQRLSLASLTRLAQSNVQTEQTRKERDDNIRKLERLEEQRRADILKEIQDAQLKVASLRTHLNSLRQKAAINAGGIQGAGDAPKVTMRLFRLGEPLGGLTIEDDETKLLPGDVLEINVQLESLQPIDVLGSEKSQTSPQPRSAQVSEHQVQPADPNPASDHRETGLSHAQPPRM